MAARRGAARDERGAGLARRAQRAEGRRLTRGQGPDRRLALGAAAVAVLALALYARTLPFGFSYLDDDALILDRQAELGRPSGIWGAFARPYFPPSFPSSGRDHAYYRPIVSASYAFDAQRSGSRPFGYRLTNLVAHAVAAGLLVLLLGRMGYRAGVAAWGGALFALHPALTEAVAWIPGRNDTLLGVFALGSWLLLLRACSGGRWPARIGHHVTWLAALLSKETAIVLPVLYAAHLVAVERRPPRELLRPWLLGGWGLALAIYLGARAAALPELGGAAGVTAAGFSAHASVLVTGLGKLVLPVHLAVLATPEDSPLWPGLLAAVALLAALFVPGVRRARLLFALAGFVILVAPGLPASNLIALESRLYLPAVAIVLAACEVASAVAAPAARRMAGGAVLAAFAAIALSYSSDFRDRRSFCEAAVRGAPHSALAHRNLGVTDQLAGETEPARREYERALAEDGGEPVVRNNLAVLLMARGELPEAERLLREELALDPGYAPAHHNLALVLRALGRPGEALAHESGGAAP